MKHRRGYINLNFGAMFAGFVIAGIAIGILIAWLAPIVWSWVRPLIHGWTA